MIGPSTSSMMFTRGSVSTFSALWQVLRPNSRLLAIAMPLRYAGLGLLNFQYEAALRFLAGALALNDSHSLTLANSETWSSEVSKAIALCRACFSYRC